MFLLSICPTNLYVYDEYYLGLNLRQEKEGSQVWCVCIGSQNSCR